MDKKKRGRKPKSKIVINENPVFSKNEKLDNLIVCLKEKTDSYMNNSSTNILYTNETTTNESNTNEDTTNEVDTNEINNLAINDSLNFEELNETSYDSCCWNCSYGLVNLNIISIPLKYSDNVFHTYGNFCSYECGARFLIDNYENKDLWDKYSLLNLYYNKCKNTHNKVVNFAPNKLLLKKFGGDLEIDEYRKKNTKDIYDIYLPPIIPINHNNHTFESKKNNELNDLKIYRKKSQINKQNIFDTMNINKD